MIEGKVKKPRSDLNLRISGTFLERREGENVAVGSVWAGRHARLYKAGWLTDLIDIAGLDTYKRSYNRSQYALCGPDSISSCTCAWSSADEMDMFQTRSSRDVATIDLIFFALT